MKKLDNIQNYINIEDGIIIDKEISDDITVNDYQITVNQASSLQINYLSKNSDEVNIDIIINCDLDLIESYTFNNDSKLNKNIIVNDNVHLVRYVDNQTDNKYTLNINETVKVNRDSVVRCAYVELSNVSIENHINYLLEKENAQVTLRFAGLAKSKESKKITLSLEHNAPYTSGLMENYGLVQDEATLIIDGIGRINKGNHQSNNQQVNKIIVTDEKCVAQANPYLYIDEYDVKAGHGATVGKIDEDQLYYLQSRGLSRHDAMHLVVYGYYLPVLEFINNDELQEMFKETLQKKVGI